jgi:hypothetical protein
VRNVNGTCTWSCAAAAAVSAGAAPGFFAEGSNRYSISVKRPSGGTNETVFDCVKRLSLSKVIRSVRVGSLHTRVRTGHKGGRKAQ